MIPISSGVPRPAAAPAVREAERAQEARPAGQPASEESRKPLRDEYVPEEKQKPCGRYWLGKDEDGSPKIYFDDPEAEDGKKEPAAPEKSAPENKAPKKERCVADTGEVDRELERLREKRTELARQLSSETDAAKARSLERKLTRVERELGQKDNDAYRRRHTKFTKG